MQKMAYRLLCEQEFCPYEEDYEAFETIVRFCRGSSLLVKVFEGLLTSKEKGVLQSIAKDIDEENSHIVWRHTHVTPPTGITVIAPECVIGFSVVISKRSRKEGWSIEQESKRQLRMVW